MSSDSTCQAFLNSAIKSAAPAIGQAINKLLTGALSAANITKCLTCASDGFDKSKPKCGNDNDNSNEGSGDKKSSAPSKEEKVIKKPVKEKTPNSGTNESEFIEYPEKFKEDVQGSANVEKVTKFGAVANPNYREGDVPGPIAVSM